MIITLSIALAVLYILGTVYGIMWAKNTNEDLIGCWGCILAWPIVAIIGIAVGMIWDND